METFTQPFSATTVPLLGNNLIEASAGTGKTYSIGILLLRAIIENQIPIRNILLVTFTEAAAFELKSRTRAFLDAALIEISAPGSTGNHDIATVVQRALQNNQTDVSASIERALQDIELAQISTIHSFCNRTLKELAFETGETFNMQLVENVDDILDLKVNEYWRRHIATKKVSDVSDVKISRTTIKNALRKVLSGEKFFFDKSNTKETFVRLQTIVSEALEVLEKEVTDYLRANQYITFDHLIQNLHNKRNIEAVKKTLLDNYQLVFVDEFQDTDRKQYEIFRDVFEKSDAIVFYIGDPKQSIYSWRGADLQVYFDARKNGTTVYSMNTNFRSTPEYIESLNAFYEEDEANNDFHPFASDLSDAHKIDYIKKFTNPKQQEGWVLKDEQSKLPPLGISIVEKEEKLERVTIFIKHLLINCRLQDKEIRPANIAILVRKNKEAKEIKEQLSKVDIPAIVIDDSSIFETREAVWLARLLEAILEVNEQNVLKALLSEILGFSINELRHINLNEIYAFFTELQMLWKSKGIFVMSERVFDYFKLEEKWGQHITRGHRMLSNLKQLIELLQKEETLHKLKPVEQLQFLRKSRENDDQNEAETYTTRIESDESAIQITTIHKSKGLTYDIVVLPYLEFENKPYWKYVYFSFKNEKDDKVFTMYQKSEISQSSKEYPKWHKSAVKINEDENRRLMYVALTRARYHSFIFYHHTKKKEGTTVENFVAQVYKKRMGKAFEMDWSAISGSPSLKKTLDIPETNISKPFPDHRPADISERRISYSYLASGSTSNPIVADAAYPEDSYEHFIYFELPKGMYPGSMVHALFEAADFTVDRNWELLAASIYRHFYPRSSKELSMSIGLSRMLKQVVDTPFMVGDTIIQLKNITSNKRINELEFHFPVPDFFDSKSLENIFPKEDSRSIDVKKGKWKGMMTGYIDLVFEYEGKFYILDWKSNYLGDKYQDYARENLLESMNEHNYHLQYLIYVLALHRFLKNRLGGKYSFTQHFGGVIYAFIRGINGNAEYGWFTQTISEEELAAIESKLV